MATVRLTALEPRSPESPSCGIRSPRCYGTPVARRHVLSRGPTPQGGSDARRAERLEGELGSLREMYARKIASTELRCDSALREKDNEMDAWYKGQKSEMLQMRAGFTVFHALSKLKTQRFARTLDGERKVFQEQIDSLQSQCAALEERRRSEVAQVREELNTRCADYESRLEAMRHETLQLQESLNQHEKRAINSAAEVVRLQGECSRLETKSSDLQRLLNDRKTEDLLEKRNRQIAELEAELVSVQKALKAKHEAEVQALNEEIMGYVKLLVTHLPEDWQQRMGQGNASEAPPLANLARRCDGVGGDASARTEHSLGGRVAVAAPWMPQGPLSANWPRMPSQPARGPSRRQPAR